MDGAAFDEASAAWRENKIARKGGAFSYKCCYIHSNGKLCKKPCVDIVPSLPEEEILVLTRVSAVQTVCKQHMRFGKPNVCLNTVSDICNKNNGATATATATAFTGSVDRATFTRGK